MAVRIKPDRHWCRRFSLGTAFAAGYAYAKALFEFGRARWGVKGHASRVDEVDEPLDTPACAIRIVGWLQGKRSAALNRSESFG